MQIIEGWETVCSHPSFVFGMHDLIPPDLLNVELLAATPAEAATSSSFQQTADVIASALEYHVAQYLVGGQYRTVLEAVAPSSTPWFLDVPGAKPGPNAIPLQVARLTPELTRKAPSVLIEILGHEQQAIGLGGIAGSYRNAQDGEISILSAKTIVASVQLTCTTGDKSSCNALTNLVVDAFSTCQPYTTNWLLLPTNSPSLQPGWNLTLPYSPTRTMPQQQDPGPDSDPRAKQWVATVQIDGARLETGTLVRLDSPAFLAVSHPTLDSALDGPSSSLPNVLELGSETPVVMLNRPIETQVLSSNPNVALVRDDGFAVSVLARSRGLFELRLVGGNNLLYSKSCEVA